MPLKKLICGFLIAAAGLATPLYAEQPNIVLIYLDDFGWRDAGFMGSDFYETPNLDALAHGGIIFDNAYSGAANCAPARACLLSGQYTPRHKIFNVGTRPRGNRRHRRLQPIPGTNRLNPQIKTWADQLGAAGYKMATIGKWHLSDDPLKSGFDFNVGGSHSGGPPRGYYPPHPNAPNLQDAPKGEYLTDRLSSEACDFIRQNKDKPWMVYLTHFAVHTPIEGKTELLPKYRNKQPGELHDNVQMAAMIQAVDDGVGKIIKTLEELNLRNNTAIIIYSDNGGYGPATDMDPLKGYKGTYFEGGIRVPFAVNWPGHVAAGVTQSEPITGVDIYPTLCEIAGARLPENQTIDGRSLVPLLKGEAKNFNRDGQPRPLFWHFPAYLQSYKGVYDEQPDPLFRSRPCSVIRQGDWKLILYFETGKVSLFNLRHDIGETSDLAATQPEKANGLLKRLEQWQSSIDAPVPSKLNPEFDESAEQAAIGAVSGKKKTRKDDKKTK